MSKTTRSVTIAETDKSRFAGALFLPESETGPGVVLMPEVFGVTDAVIKLAEGFAIQGYVVLVPDMFWRAGENLAFGYERRRDAGDAFLLAGGSIGHKQNFTKAAAALSAMPACDGGVAAVGFGVGALTAFSAAAANLVEAAVSFYPSILPLGDAGNMATAWQYHHGGADIFVRDNLLNDTKAMLREHSGIDIRTYPGAAHGFAMPDSPGYDAEAASNAVAASYEFLAGALNGGRGKA